ncbi:MAG: hypothetical protein M2R45_02144 [Verrucomicrobia subdivision 3 bacterium]|nr:hypothetical protein [Limisphaerales bacterium]MCS1413721.1 hypothetical protein [Limisphaerales bacterium]
MLLHVFGLTFCVKLERKLPHVWAQQKFLLARILPEVNVGTFAFLEASEPVAT